MKKSVTLVVMLLLSGGIFAQQLSYRFANPRIIRLSNVDNLQYDVQIKCSQAGTFLWLSQIKLNFNNTTFNNTATTWTVTKAGDFNTLNTQDGFKYTVTKTITGTAPNKVFNLALTGDVNVQGNGPNADDFTEVPVEWTTLVTISSRLAVATGDALAGIDFLESGMNGYQQYISGPTEYTLYTNPNIFDSKDFLSDYTGRFYSTSKGWSQIGGGTNNVQFLNWATNVSTTVWENASITQTDNTAALANNLLIQSDAVLNLPTNKWLTVSGDLTNSSAANLVIEDGASLLHNTADVPATINRIITGSTDQNAMMYHFVSVPLTVAASPLSDIFLGSYLFDFTQSTGQWNGLGTSTTTPLDVTKGYMMYYIGGTSVTNTFSGPMNNGTFTTSTSYNLGQGFNLVPNPYPSAIDWLNGSWVKTGIDNPIYIWPAGAAANSANYVSFVGGVGTNGGTQFIPLGQSFFVHANVSPTLSMDNTVRVHNAQSFWKSYDAIPDLLRINALANNITDEMVVRFSETATTHFDGDWDAYKLAGGSDAPQLSSITEDGIRLTINSLPYSNTETVVPLHFSLTSDASVNFIVSELGSFASNITIYLEDRLLNKTINLRESASYSFNHAMGDEANRFYLHFYGVNATNESVGENFKLWTVSDKVKIIIPSLTGENVQVEMFDLQGHIIVKQQLTISTPCEFSVFPFHGFGLVRIISENKVYSKKVFIQ